MWKPSENIRIPRLCCVTKKVAMKTAGPAGLHGWRSASVVPPGIRLRRRNPIKLPRPSAPTAAAAPAAPAVKQLEKLCEQLKQKNSPAAYAALSAIA